MAYVPEEVLIELLNEGIISKEEFEVALKEQEREAKKPIKDKGIIKRIKEGIISISK